MPIPTWQTALLMLASAATPAPGRAPLSCVDACPDTCPDAERGLASTLLTSAAAAPDIQTLALLLGTLLGLDLLGLGSGAGGSV